MMKLNVVVRKLMEGKNIAFLATINRDGSPQVTPTWIDTDGEYAIINTAIGRVKQNNVNRDRRVAVSVIDQADPYSFASLQGRVVEQITGHLAEDHADKLAKKYMNVEKYPESHRELGEKRVILKISVDRIFVPTWD